MKPIAEQIWDMKYRLHAQDGTPVDLTVEDTWKRVANALAAADPQSSGGARLWAGYVTSWTAWNHVRTASALAAAVLLTFALSQ